MAHRPSVNIHGGKASKTIPLPDVLLAPLRHDIVQYVHTNLSKNKRQPYAVNKYAGMNHSAESWGTGRAVSRIPRVSGGGTHRAGQGAFGNMCRKGRMFAPTRLERRWHRKINKNQRRYAVCSALAATAVPALVMARGHRINGIPEIPLVLADELFEGVTKTKEAMKIVQKFKIDDEVNQVRASRRTRAGKGKARNRRHISKRGPLVVHSGSSKGLVLSFRNIPGLKLTNVYRLNLLDLAPGGHVGRFIIWTESAFRALNKIFGSFTRASGIKKGYRPPRAILYNPDITRIINSEEVKAVVKTRKHISNKLPQKRNPLRNIKAYAKLNPYGAGVKKHTLARNLDIQRNRDLRKANPPKNKTKKQLTPERLKKRKDDIKNKKKQGKTRKAATAEFRKMLLTPAVAPAKSADETGEV